MRKLALAVVATLLAGCFTITNERPTYEELDPAERGAIETVLAELRGFDGRLMASRGCSISEVLDRERIDVAFEGIMLAGNLGDNIIHVALWENLTEEQRGLVQSWFKAEPAAAKALHEKLFYQFLAVTQGAKQLMFEVLEVPWLFQHRSLFNLERDATRIAISQYDAAGRGAEMRGFLTSACGPLLAGQAEVWAPRFANGKEYLKDPFNLQELYKPEAPVGFLYFTCAWAKLAIQPGTSDSAEGLGEELDWILSFRDRRCLAGGVVNANQQP